MRTLRFLPGLAVLAMLAFVIGAEAQDKKPIAEKHDGQALSDSLREVVNTGADLFNKYGDYAGCYRLYQGGLLSIKPFLTPELQKRIEKTIEKAEGLPRYSDRAFELRTLLGEIREKSMGAPAAATKKEEKKAETKKEEAKGGAKKEEKKADTKKDGKMSAALIDPNAGQVMGKVTYEGKPAPPGFVTLVGASQKFSASITDDGSYKFKTPIPPGVYRIAIERVPGAQIPAKLDIPERFRAEATSGLTYQVQKGMQVFDINLSK